MQQIIVETNVPEGYRRQQPVLDWDRDRMARAALPTAGAATRQL
jgi:hypothetical protein